VSAGAYPEVSDSLELRVSPSRANVVCMSCTEGPQLDEETDPVEWALKHATARPWHTRYRVEHLTNFSVPAEQPAEVVADPPPEPAS
jgi:hypothetical protein